MTTDRRATNSRRERPRDAARWLAATPVPARNNWGRTSRPKSSCPSCRQRSITSSPNCRVLARSSSPIMPPVYARSKPSSRLRSSSFGAQARRSRRSPVPVRSRSFPSFPFVPVVPVVPARSRSFPDMLDRDQTGGFLVEKQVVRRRDRDRGCARHEWPGVGADGEADGAAGRENRRQFARRSGDEPVVRLPVPLRRQLE